MKLPATHRTRSLFLLKASIALLFVFAQFSSPAQTPVISSSAGIPSGNGNITGVAYGNGVYVAIRNSGGFYYSSDGVDWTKADDAGIPSGSFRKIAFGSGIFVVAGYSGVILTSADGQSWTQQVSGTANNLYDVQFIEGAFYATGQNATLLYSADGIVWSSRTMGSGLASHMFMNITYGNGYYVMSARTSGSSGIYIYRSATGASGTWSFQDIAFGTVNKVQFLNDRFFIFTSATNVYTSTDGGSWTNSTASMPVTLPNATVQNIGSPNQVFNGFHDGSKYYLFGSSQYYGGYGSIYSSTNGVDFTLQERTAYIVCQGSAVLNGKYFQWGNEGLVSSDDGINYKYPTGSYNCLASNGSGYVAVGYIGSGGVIFSSPDFQNWTNTTPADQKDLYAVEFTGTKYIAAGNRSVLESNDGGMNWISISTPSKVITGLAWGDSRLVAAGYDPSTWEGKLTYSADGISWTTAVTDDNYYFRIKYLDGEFLALGYSNITYEGVVMHSADGISWSDITPNEGFQVYYYHDAVYENGKFHLMGVEYDDYDLFTLKGFFSLSTSTLTPSGTFTKAIISSPPGGSLIGGSFGEGAFAYSNGKIVGSGVDINTNQTYLLHSTDGLSWEAVAVDGFAGLYGIVAVGDNFYMAGMDDLKLTATFSSTLPVNFLSFTAKPVGEQVELKWITSSERNSGIFIVQHSTDGSLWSDIGSVAAAGESSNRNSYSFIHDNPVKGKNYYRLQQKDADGAMQYSTIVKLDLSAASLVTIYPNPAKEKLNVELTADSPSLLMIYDAGGRQILRTTKQGRLIELPLNKLEAGIYQLIIVQEGKRISRTIIKE